MAFEYIYYSLVAAIVLIVIIFWIYLETRFKNKVRIKEIVNGRKIIKNYRARYYEDSDKSAWWKLAGERRKSFRLIPIPPEDAIEIDGKGKKYVEAHRFETGEVVFIKDDHNMLELPDLENVPEIIQTKIEEEKDFVKKKDILDDWKKGKIAEWRKKNKIISPYHPVTTNQRMGYFYNIKKAESRKAFDWKAQLIPITAIGGIVIIVLALIVLFGEIAEPVLQADMIAQNTVQAQKETVQILQDIKNNQQTISQKLNQIDTDVPD